MKTAFSSLAQDRSHRHRGDNAPAMQSKAPQGEEARPLLSVIIKTLNEAEKIGACLASVLEAVHAYPTQVIVADSRSDDATTEIARSFGVNVVTLAADEARSCGVGPQLGYQHATGQYLLLLDGDMQLHPAFLPAALHAMEEDPCLAGVGGGVEFDAANLEYRLRRERGMPHLQPGYVNRLEGGGLFRREAVDQLGYFTNQNLHSFEEFDLGLRLQESGWRLRRIGVPAVSHSGHTMPALTLLMRRWRTRYVDGQGEVLRAAFGTARIPVLLRAFWISLAVVAWWGALLLCVLLVAWQQVNVYLALALAGLPLVVMVLKKRSLVKGGYAVLQWQVCAAGMLRGLMRPQHPPTRKVSAQVIATSAMYPIGDVPPPGVPAQRQPAAAE
ncbi:glycosyltransferase [Roseomonas sp. M0104]|uniref:Glycosyltransferase n=1 Tax=Teichococcus coralli TaxID=2545983 RepID=A0A845BI45_9PROT|nr:glycosyltransferase [Pseudoroseomonas coralli]MXP63109.1 glycosyltransferase [Pseudoroseomonas coralli]